MLFGIHGIEESTVYQGILRRGRAEGEAKGRAEEARKILIRQGRKRFGPLDGHVEAQIAALDDLDRLDDLIDRVLDVGSWDELLAPSDDRGGAPV